MIQQISVGVTYILLNQMDAKLSQFHIKNAVSVKEIGYHEDKNYPSRQNMEDCNDKTI